MKLFSISLLILFFNFSKIEDHDSKLECVDFHNGKFELINEEQNKKYIIEREGNFQTEETYNLESGKKISKRYFKLKWLSECECNLLIDPVKNKLDEVDIMINAKGGVTCTVLSIENNCATIRSSVGDFEVQAKICKIQ